MSTISTEQAKYLRNAFECWQQDYDPVEDKEQYDMFWLGIMAMDELLTLRKEREKSEPVAYMIGGHYLMHANDPKVDNYSSAVALYTAPPAPVVVDDSLPFDPQIAEYEQMMEAEQAQADATAQHFESLAGKAVVPDGWKMVPIELTKEMRGKIHPFAEALCHGCGREVVADCEDNVTASWNDMLAVAPEPCK